jgi:NADPH2:quinone reductase
MQIQETMKAVALESFGGLDRMRIRELPVPDIEPDEVLIRVDTAGVGEWDPAEREGQLAELLEDGPRFPYVLGSDGSGTVVAVGADVKNVKEGDRVYSCSFLNPKGGFYAQYVPVKATLTAPVPRKLDMEQAGAMPVGAVTALRGLQDVLQLQSGENLLIFGASGDVGHLGVQLAKRMGARVLAVASGDDGVELVKQLGADAAVDGKHGDIEAAIRSFAPDGLDAALVTVNSRRLDQALLALKNGGRVAYPNGVEPEPQARPDIDTQGYDFNPDAAAFQKLNQLIEAGPFHVHIADRFSLEQAAAAQRALEDHHLGKIVLKAAS